MRLAALALLAGAHGALAQSGARITGTVTDSNARPMARADVAVQPGGKRTTTDSAGRFTIAGLGADQYTVRARRMGYAPADWTVDLSKGGHAEVHLTLGARLSLLDTVVVAAGRSCTANDIDGFLCRRRRAKGLFLDYDDIDAMNVLYTSDVFRDVEGFRVDVVPSRTGPKRIPVGTRCVNTLIDGRPAGWNSVPAEPYDIAAIEIYRNPREIPPEFARYTWGKEQCWLVVYWTVSFAHPITRPRLPQRQMGSDSIYVGKSSLTPFPLTNFSGRPR